MRIVVSCPSSLVPNESSWSCPSITIARRFQARTRRDCPRDEEPGRRSLTTTKGKRRYLIAASPLDSYVLTAVRPRLWRGGCHRARTATATAVTTARMTATPKTLLLGHNVRDRIVGLLLDLLPELGLVLSRDVPSDGVIPGERSRAVRTRHPDALVTLPYVSAQVRLVAV